MSFLHSTPARIADSIAFVKRADSRCMLWDGSGSDSISLRLASSTLRHNWCCCGCATAILRVTVGKQVLYVASGWSAQTKNQPGHVITTLEPTQPFLWAMCARRSMKCTL